VEITRVGGFRLGWGEGLCWDERRERLYFVDCAAQTLHWLDGGGDAPQALKLPSMATRVVPTEADAVLVGILDDGVHVIDVDRGTSELLAPYPAKLGGRCNDACADTGGNLVTGKLNMEAAPGSVWRYSTADGWRLLDDDISNTNGPNVGELGGATTLIVGDTATHYYAYDYDPGSGVASNRRVFADVQAHGGQPDGARLDAAGGLWCALVGGARLARFTADGLDRIVDLPVQNPTDVTLAGDRAYVVSIGLGVEEPALDGALLAIDGLGCTARPEPRFRL